MIPQWQPNSDKLDAFRARESVLNRDLEVSFAPGGRQAGDIPFRLLKGNRGFSQDLLASKLVVHLESAIPLKWVEDLKKAKLELSKLQHVVNLEGTGVIGKRKEALGVCLLFTISFYNNLGQLQTSGGSGGKEAKGRETVEITVSSQLLGYNRVLRFGEHLKCATLTPTETTVRAGPKVCARCYEKQDLCIAALEWILHDSQQDVQIPPNNAQQRGALLASAFASAVNRPQAGVCGSVRRGGILVSQGYIHWQWA
ncbi:hypothetical protein BDN71DRAFT_1496434 [Pleurotus eryngii]|uniref:Uncharacterized protein n=1 Tax=Pleurotus eryngii TaxID=5323 RepID=A0A9P6DEU8_PLEER|nr:hypothetical protein BDN71DRAFT_1496434 [Pleurotus eryngii]